ncbi:hypothetical protein K435DRAFT_112962 [Dendrothele bispora CBS 962.96]|uniref:Winged helix-turn helix domain-containing protein n=1 Tax=Dendrothele bispora (strain CBS 962.96) TaxID=1314807 RepID=A0A4S8M1B5_DENBC|nr:hypothetical protein K435DRAFT_112962 [Dendrothele bispora CBS 962.96]
MRGTYTGHHFLRAAGRTTAGLQCVFSSLSTISRVLHRRGWTRKKVTWPAAERNEDDRAMYQILIGQYYRPEQLVFCDESAVDGCSCRRGYVWARIES